MSSRPNGPPGAYAYITNTNGRSAALRTTARTTLGLLVLAEMFAASFASRRWICPAEGSALCPLVGREAGVCPDRIGRGGTHPPSKWKIIKRKELREGHFASV